MQGAKKNIYTLHEKKKIINILLDEDNKKVIKILQIVFIKVVFKIIAKYNKISVICESKSNYKCEKLW